MYTSEIRNPKSRKIPGAITRLGEVYDPSTMGPAPPADYRTDTYLVQQLHALAQAIYQAQQRNDVEGVRNLRDAFKGLADEYRERGSIGVSPFDQMLLSIDEWIRKAGVGAINLAQSVGIGALKGLWPFALIAAGLIYVKGKLF